MTTSDEAIGPDPTPRPDDSSGRTDVVDAFIARFDEDWIKAGVPTAHVTIALVQEIKRLRDLMREIVNRCDRWNENGADRGVDHAVMLAKRGLGVPSANQDYQTE